MPELCLRPVQELARARKAGAEIHVLEPGRHETAVEALERPERALANRQGGRGGLLDLERAVPVAIGIPPAAAAAVVRSERVHQEQLARIGGEAREPAQLKRELVFTIGRREKAPICDW
jgi:hypothetical protein